MRDLLVTETELLSEIAALHERIPESYLKGYSASTLDIALRFESMQLLMQHKGDRIVVVEREQQLYGFIWFNVSDVIHIKSTYVKENYRQQGLATKLKRYIEEIALANKITRIVSDVNPNNTPMVQLNEKLGYQRSETSNRMIKMIEV